MFRIFWQCIIPPENVGTSKDKDKTTVECDEWEQALNDHIRGNSAPYIDSQPGPITTRSEIAGDDDSHYSANSVVDVQSVAGSVQTYHVSYANSDSDNNGLDDVAEMDGEHLLQNAVDGLKKIGNAGKKSYNTLATSDVFKRGNLLLSISICKKRKKALEKKERKRTLTLMAASYFENIMRIRRQHLAENLHRSQNMQYVYNAPMWKKRYNEYITHRVSSVHLFPESTDNATDKIIRNAMQDVWDLADPRDFQVDAGKRLAFFPNTLLYIISKTGSEKSAIPLTTGTLTSGVIITLVPLIGLGSDQVAKSRNANHYIEAYHLDEQNNESARELSKRLNTMHQTEANHCTIFL